MSQRLEYFNCMAYYDSGEIKQLSEIDPLTGEMKFHKIPGIIHPNTVVEVPDEYAEDLYRKNTIHYEFIRKPTEIEILLWEKSGKLSIC